MTDRAPYVSVYPSDWMAGCATLPAMTEWLYHQICLHNWDKGEPIPEKHFAMVFMRHPKGEDGWRSDLELLIDLGKIVRTQSGSVWSKRALIEAEKAQSALEKRKAGGKKGAEKRWNNSSNDSSPMANPSKSNGIPYGNQNQNQSQSQSDSNESHPQTPKQIDMLDRIKPDVWRDFAEHRIKLKKPMTERAATMMRNKLVEIAEETGHDPNSILEQSIMRGWLGVFPLKDDDKGNGKRSGWRFDDER